MKRLITGGFVAAAVWMLAGTTPALAGKPEAAPATKSAPKAEKPKDINDTLHVCPMHPKVEKKGPGTCPDCEMDLVPKK